MIAKDDNSRRLADAFYHARLDIKAAEERSARLRAEILELDASILVGAEARVTVDVQKLSRLDGDAVRMFLNPEQFAKCMKTTDTVFVRAKPFGGKKATQALLPCQAAANKR